MKIKANLQAPPMESLISTQPPSLFSPSHPSISSPSIPTRPPHLHQRRRPNLLILLCSSNPTIPTAFNGWDDDLDQTTTPNPDPLLTFLTPLGINRTHLTIFLLGFLSSLAFFKARFTPMVVIPISVAAFVAGFSAGATQPGSLFGLLGQFGRRDSFDEKAREVGEFLDDLGEKMAHLKDGLEGAIQRNGLDVGSVRSYLDVVEVVSSVADQTKKSIEGSIDREMRKSSQKPSKKRREGAVDGFDFMQHIGSVFEDYLIGFGPQKLKTVNKAEKMEEVVSGNADGDVKTEFKAKQKPNSNLRNSGTRSGDAPDSAVFDNPVVNGDESRYGRDGRFADDMFSYDDELQSSRTTVQYTTKRRSFEELVFKQIYKGGTQQNDTYESAGHGRRVTESMDFTSSESFSENSLETHEKSYFVSREREPRMSKSEHGIKYEQDMEADDRPSSSNTSADEEFNRNVKEATHLLKLARECLVKQFDEEKADSMLYKASRLLSTAVALKPMSLLAMGQLGNTYLLHGELKLKVSREIRTLMPRSDGLLNSNGRGSRLNKLDTRALSRENITSVLIDVCEECDKLLVEAGRKYRKALAIDADDIRALYNWGLALSFRAQLIADIGPEAAIDADKVYLAAIDKFNAMTSRSNAYAPDALYRWGLALQQRSYLRPDRSRDRMKLLQQAKSLYEDVLSVESDNKMVREALSSCLSEIEYSRLW